MLLEVLWAPVNLMVTLAKDGGFSSVGVGTMRWVSLSVLMTLLLQLPLFRKMTGYKSMERADWVKSFLIGLLLFGPAHILYYASMGLTSEVEGTVLLCTAPLFTAVFAFFFLQEKVPTKRWLAIGLSIVGAYIVAVGFAIPQLQSGTKGNLMFFSGVIIECLMGVIAAKISRRTSGVSVLSAQMWGGGAAFIVAALLFPTTLNFKIPAISTAYLPVLYLIVCSGLITFTVWYRIVETTPLTLLVVSIAVQPPISAILNYLVKGTVPEVNTWIGCVVILVALGLGFLGEKSSSTSLDPAGPGG